MDQIRITLPDGSVKEVPKGTTAVEIAKSISPRLPAAAPGAQKRAKKRGGAPQNGDLLQLCRSRRGWLPALRPAPPYRTRHRLANPHGKRPGRPLCLPPFRGAPVGRGRDGAVPQRPVGYRPAGGQRLLLRVPSRRSVHSRGSRKNRKEDARVGKQGFAERAQVAAQGRGAEAL